MSTLTDKAGPIEVWLTQINIKITCMIAHDDETTEALDVDSLSMRGAQREVTGFLKAKGYEPAGRWETETSDDDHGGSEETCRRFKPA